MAEYRSIHTRIWEDTWFRSQPADGKLLFIYLFSNHRASVCGVYRITVDFMAFETGIRPTACLKLLEQFEQEGKVFFADDLIWVVKMRDLQDTGSDSLRKRMDEDIAKLPDGRIKTLYQARYQVSPPPSPHRPPTVPTPITTVTVTDTVTDTGTVTDAPRAHPIVRKYIETFGIQVSGGSRKLVAWNALCADLMQHPKYDEDLACAYISKWKQHKLTRYQQRNPGDNQPDLAYFCNDSLIPAAFNGGDLPGKNGGSNARTSKGIRI